MATLTISYTAPSPAPALGYRISYRKVGMFTYTEVTSTLNPVVISNLDPVQYEGFMIALCAEGSESSPQPFVSTVNQPINCGNQANYTGGEAFPYEQVIVFGNATGTVTMNFDAIGIPDRFQVFYNGTMVIDTGYRGDGGYQTELNTALQQRWQQPQTIQGGASGSVTFSKNQADVTTCLVKVYAPLANTEWNFTMSCPIIDI